MNGKKAKALRRLVRRMGHTNAALPAHHISLSGQIVPASHHTAGQRGNVTASYPTNSFQAVYTSVKRRFGRMTIAEINQLSAY